MSDYSKIKDPMTGQLVELDTALGKRILYNYIKEVQNGGDNDDEIGYYSSENSSQYGGENDDNSDNSEYSSSEYSSQSDGESEDSDNSEYSSSEYSSQSGGESEDNSKYYSSEYSSQSGGKPGALNPETRRCRYHKTFQSRYCTTDADREIFKVRRHKYSNEMDTIIEKWKNTTKWGRFQVFMDMMLLNLAKKNNEEYYKQNIEYVANSDENYLKGEFLKDGKPGLVDPHAGEKNAALQLAAKKAACVDLADRIIRTCDDKSCETTSKLSKSLNIIFRDGANVQDLIHAIRNTVLVSDSDRDKFKNDLVGVLEDYNGLDHVVKV